MKKKIMYDFYGGKMMNPTTTPTVPPSSGNDDKFEETEEEECGYDGNGSPVPNSATAVYGSTTQPVQRRIAINDKDTRGNDYEVNAMRKLTKLVNYKTIAEILLPLDAQARKRVLAWFVDKVQDQAAGIPRYIEKQVEEKYNPLPPPSLRKS